MTAHPDRDPEVRERSRELDERRRELIAASHTAPRPPLAQLGALMTLLVSVFLLVAQWEVYPMGAQSQTNGLWSLGFAILAGLGALRLLMGEPGRHLTASALILLSGAGLLLRAFLAAHETASTVAVEATCGVLLVIGGLMAFASPATSLRQLPSQRDD